MVQRFITALNGEAKNRAKSLDLNALRAMSAGYILRGKVLWIVIKRG
jgi:hypothetical protein